MRNIYGQPTLEQSEVDAITHAGFGGATSQAFPVGSVFIAVVNTDPATLLGYGTWSAFGAGRVLIGLDSGDADFNSAEKTGGAKTVAAAGTVSQPTFTGDAWAAPAISWPAAVPTFTGSPLASTTFAIPTGTGSFKGTSSGGFSTVGGAAPGSTGATTSKSPGTPAGTVAWPASVPAIGAYTPTGTVSAPTLTGSATSVVQPYIVVYMWKRTA